MCPPVAWLQRAPEGPISIVYPIIGWILRRLGLLPASHENAECALGRGVPVVPMTIHGAHRATFVLAWGRWLAHLMGIDRLHVNVFPFVWNLPLGLTPAFVPSLVLPSEVTVQIDWSRYGRAAAADPAVVRACYEEITCRMQADLDALAREHPCPVLSRLRGLVCRPSGIAGGAARVAQTP